MIKLDTDFVRSQFPAFSQDNLQGQAFFENAGGSYACAQVIDRLTRFYTRHKVQPYAPYRASAEGGAMMDDGYKRLAGLFNVSEDEMNFGPSTTQNTYVLAQAFKGILKEGDEIIVTNQDHEANTGAWRKLADAGITAKEWQVNPETGELELDKLNELLASGKVKLVTFPHCSNIVAHINPVAEIAKHAHEAGAVVVVDGVSYAPHGLPDVEALGADVYLCSLYKVYGPHQGAMVVRRPLRERLANQSHYFNADEPHKKLVPAGPDHAQIGSAAGIAEYFDALHAHHFDGEVDDAELGRRVSSLMRSQEIALSESLIAYVEGRNDLRLIGPADAAKRAPTIAVETRSRDPQEVAEALAEHGIMCWAGDFYSPRVLEAMGLDPARGVLRLSFVHYTSDEEIVSLKSALDTVLNK